jgi:TonB family protein
MLPHFKTSVLAGLLMMAVSLQAEQRPPKKRVAPIYPELAKKMHISGAVKLELDVDPEGQVKDVKVVKGHALLRDAAVSAAKQWVFTKASDKSVEVIEVDFQQE